MVKRKHPTNVEAAIRRPLGVESPGASSFGRCLSGALALATILAISIAVGMSCSSEPKPQTLLAEPSVPQSPGTDGGVPRARVDQLIRQLESGTLAERSRAAYELGDMGQEAPRAAKQAVPALIRALRDKSSSVRERAARALGQIHDPRAVDPLIAAYRAAPKVVESFSDVPQEWTAFRASKALVRIGPPAVGALARALADPDRQMREGSAIILGRIGPPARGALPALRAATKDRDQIVRLAAARAIRAIVRPATCPSEKVAWGRAVNGLQAGLRSKGFADRAKTKLSLVFSLRNAARKRSWGEYLPIEVKVADKILPYKGPVLEPGPPPGRNEFIDLAPGQADSVEAVMILKHWGLEDPANAEITFVFQNRRQRERDPKVEGLWTGVARSAAVATGGGSGGVGTAGRPWLLHDGKHLGVLADGSLRWKFTVDDLAAVYLTGRRGSRPLSVPKGMWAVFSAALDKADQKDPSLKLEVGMDRGVLLVLKNGQKIYVEGGARQEYWRYQQHWQHWGKGPPGLLIEFRCPALVAAVTDARTPALASNADRIVVARRLGLDGRGIRLKILKTLKGSLSPWADQTLGGAAISLMPAGSVGKKWIVFIREEGHGRGTPGLHPLQVKDWFLPRTEATESRVRNAIPLPRRWGMPVKGLRMGLRPRARRFRSDSEIPVEIAIWNVSDKPIQLRQHRYNIYDYYGFTRFTVTDPQGRRFVLAKPVTQMTESDHPLPRTLAPRGTYIHTVRLNQWPTLDPKQGPVRKRIFKTPGDYRVTCTYKTHKTDRAPPGQWTGTLASDTVTVKVVPESAAQAAEKAFVEARLRRLWVALGSADAQEVDEAVKAMVALEDRAVAFLAERFEPAPADAGRVKALIARLDDKEPVAGEKAHEELVRLGRAALPGLRQALKRPELSAEARTRVNTIVKDLSDPPPGSARAWRWERALNEVLAPIATARSNALLAHLANGDPGEGLTRLAAAAFDPWGKKAGGLRVRLIAHRKRCTAGEPMPFTLLIENVAGDVVTVWSHTYVDWQLRLTDLAGRPVRLEQRVKYQRAALRERPLFLKPQQVHRVTTDLAPLYLWLPDGKAKSFILTWHNGLKVGPKGGEAFVKLASNPVTISVAPAPAATQPAEKAKADLDARLRALPSPLKRVAAGIRYGGVAGRDHEHRAARIILRGKEYSLPAFGGPLVEADLKTGKSVEYSMSGLAMAAGWANQDQARRMSKSVRGLFRQGSKLWMGTSAVGVIVYDTLTKTWARHDDRLAAVVAHHTRVIYADPEYAFVSYWHKAISEANASLHVFSVKHRRWLRIAAVPTRDALSLGSTLGMGNAVEFDHRRKYANRRHVSIGGQESPELARPAKIVRRADDAYLLRYAWSGRNNERKSETELLVRCRDVRAAFNRLAPARPTRRP